MRILYYIILYYSIIYYVIYIYAYILYYITVLYIIFENIYYTILIYIYTQIVGWSIHIFLPGRSCQAEPGGFQVSDGPGAATEICRWFFNVFKLHIWYR